MDKPGRVGRDLDVQLESATGGMASVWLAHDRRLQRRVAVKILSDVLAADHGYVRRFRREARVAAGLAHPNLVSVYDFGDDPRPFMVMEFIEDGNLAQRLEDCDPGIDAEALARDLLAACPAAERSSAGD